MLYDICLKGGGQFPIVDVVTRILKIGEVMMLIFVFSVLCRIRYVIAQTSPSFSVHYNGIYRVPI